MNENDDLALELGRRDLLILTQLRRIRELEAKIEELTPKKQEAKK